MQNFARKLRKDQTEAEKRLWYFLRDRRFKGLKFRRQYPIDPYIADFCCAGRKLIIELDGSQHVTQEIKDRERTEYLSKRGFRIIRFWDHEILKDTASVLEKIRLSLETCPSPLPSPQKWGEGKREETAKTAPSSVFSFS